MPPTPRGTVHVILSNHPFGLGRSLILRLFRDALHDSAERYPQPRCHPETRKRLLNILCKWDSDAASSSVMENRPSNAILWLHGPASSGKSAVAQLFCLKLEDEGRLGGSFFFRRGHPSRGNAQKLFPTIAYQLALLLPELSFRNQLQELIIKPCPNSSLSWPVPVVIDGLDECDGQDILQEVLQSNSDAVFGTDVPILFFIASRRESHICEAFADSRFNRISSTVEHRAIFQGHEFSRIHRDHWTMATVPSPWPPSEILNALVEKSSGYFIYASTVIKFVDDKRFRPV
ncbi:hypothetical protein C8J57DRAFT_1440119 [Mycena rebaudengoi]|nr:hypothetical protein C8J57DRAFT_1440119 [Mycena rebaudengoi]